MTARQHDTAGPMPPDRPRSLAARTITGAGWLMGWRLASRLLGVLNTFILVRLLLPSDFGLVALATSLSFAINGLSYLGVREALVRERTLDRGFYDTGFTMGVLRGALTAIVIVVAAGPVARAFGDPRIEMVLIALACGFFLSSFENIGIVDFQRELSFGKQVLLQLVPRVGAVLASIAIALIWRSYWALIVGMLASRVIRVALTYIVHSYRPRFGLTAWRRLIGFSFWSWAWSMNSLAQARADTLIIGSHLNTAALGIYAIAGEIGGMASSELLEPISRALFAGFSAARRGGGNVAAAYLRAIALTALLVLPASAGIALVARPAMHLLFGVRWDAAVPLVQIFAGVGVFRVGAAISGTLLIAEGAPRVAFRIELLLTVTRIVALFAMVPLFGLIGAAGAVAFTGVVEEVIYLFATFRRVDLRAVDLAANVWRPALATLAMVLLLLAVGAAGPHTTRTLPGAGFLLAETIAGGVVIYAAVLLLAWYASGRPEGAESFVLSVARRRLGSIHST
jgi:lipopolysaccharide exporter